MSPFALSRTLRFAVVALCAASTVAGCEKIRDATKQPGQAFLDSQIPPGLSPQYFPPQGFVWGAYRSKGLPEARYGVASPPINPKAQVLILADADYPAESYFEVMRQLLDAGYGVWLFEAPGQGGAGRYLLQNEAVFVAGSKDTQVSATGFINDIVKPTPEKPLFVVGTGYSAVNSLALSTVLKSDAVGGFVGYDPYVGGDIAKGTVWHREDVPNSYWGKIGQDWQMSNPDLRLRVKSENWQKQVKKAYADLNGLHLPVVALKRRPAAVLVIAPKSEPTGEANAASNLCARLPRCEVAPNEGPQALGKDIAAFIKDELSKV
ncbi:hypothetical protein [Asticcacaulis sp. AC402]|uniref:hypothetical protein n=1 Tax=Asticcacaulis sp. AC402 TaxID=1282361 RepID=UPI0003C3FD7B|nr:hypothetical protein [Asticcacaulis sp. AC402]ESQ75444.1 hypothetical protein ABAC402_10110 [Asticcacaulis sp. AC402]